MLCDCSGEENVLDWIVERKRVDDLASSIIDKRYDQQKYWLGKCGISNIVYLVEGDPDSIDRGKITATNKAAPDCHLCRQRCAHSHCGN